MLCLIELFRELLMKLIHYVRSARLLLMQQLSVEQLVSLSLHQVLLDFLIDVLIIMLMIMFLVHLLILVRVVMMGFLLVWCLRL